MDKRICRLSDKVGEMLVTQMGNELYNHALYSTMSNFCALEGVDPLAQYYKKRADEEYIHHSWIATYLTECDYSYVIPTVDKVSEKIEDIIEIFRITVDAEIKTSDDIDAIYDAAVEEKDHHTRQWLDTLLIPEQHEEETTSRAALAIMTLEDVNILVKSKEVLNLLM